MRKLLVGLVILVVLIIGGLAVVPSLVPSSVYKEKIQAQLTKELERDVTIDGEVKVSVFPSIRAKTDRVVIANPEGFSDAPFVAMDGLEAKIKLLPLFSKRVEIASFKLKNPQINLEKKSDGTSNWVFGAPSEAPTTEPTTGPFKRDGRYGNIDPEIGLFSIENGAISYADATTSTNYDLKDVNLAFTLPSLSKTVKIDGNVIFNDQPADLKLTLDSPRRFLDGKNAPVSFSLETQFTKLSAKGTFLESENIAFNFDLDGEVSDMAKLLTYVPQDIPAASLVDTAKLSGTYSFDGTVLSAKDADITATGDGLNVAFAGDATLAKTPVLAGKVSLDAQNIAKIAQVLELDITGLNIADAVNFTADLAAEGQGFGAKNIDATIKGKDIDVTFEGTGAYAETISANGAFTAKAGSIPALVKALELDIPQAAALGSADINGLVTYNGVKTELSKLSASTKGGVLEGSYTGTANIGDAVALNGTFDTVLKSLTDFATQTGMDIPYATSIGKINAKGTVSGNSDNISVSDLSAELSNGQLNGKFEGAATVGNAINIDGILDADIPSVRKLASTTGTALPSSTKAGTIYEAFKVSGTVKGTPEKIAFTNADIMLDTLNGTGTFAIDLKGVKPFVTGQLNLAGLDLRPYMASYAAQNPSGEIQPWSEQPLNLEMLKSVDGDFTFTTPNIVTDRMEMGQSDITATLRSGKMTAKLPKLNLYGGLGSVTATLDASGNVPSVALNVNMDDLNSNSFLNAVAGFANVNGEGNTVLSVRGQGATQAAIMKSLNGKGDFKLLNGEISGVDLTTLMSDLDQALTSRTLPGGIGQNYTTKFKDIVGLFKIENGVAKINQFNLDGFGVAAQGGGSIDLGNQNIDFSLRPRLTGQNASNLASFGIPIKLQGNFGSVSAGLDTDMLAKIVAAQAQVRLQKELTDKVGGPAGSIIGGILGGSNTPSSSTKNPATGDTQQPAPSPDKVVNDLFGSILGSKTKQPTTAPSTPSEVQKTEEEKKKEPTVEDALLDLFGSKKKKD